MCEIKTVLFVAALLLAATGFRIYQVNSEKKVGHNSHLKSAIVEKSTGVFVGTVVNAII